MKNGQVEEPSCSWSWSVRRKWSGSHVVYERHYDHHQTGEPLKPSKTCNSLDRRFWEGLVDGVAGGLDGLAQLPALLASGRKPGISLAIDFESWKVKSHRALSRRNR